MCFKISRHVSLGGMCLQFNQQSLRGRASCLLVQHIRPFLLWSSCSPVGAVGLQVQTVLIIVPTYCLLFFTLISHSIQWGFTKARWYVIYPNRLSAKSGIRICFRKTCYIKRCENIISIPHFLSFVLKVTAICYNYSY